MTVDGTDLLAALTGAARADLPPRHRLATVDPSYTVGDVHDPTLPKVTFDGESTLSTKLYPIVAGYVPTASDRVLMAPVGRTYVVLGTVSHPRPLRTGSRGIIAGPQILTSSSAGYTSTSDTDMVLSGVSADVTRNYRVHLHTYWALSAAALWYAALTVNGTKIARFGSTGLVIPQHQISSGLLWQPASGTYTLRVIAEEGTGAETFTLTAAADTPRQFWVEDIGPR